MEANQQKSMKKKIISFVLVFSIILSSIIYLYISNYSTNSNTRRKINEIQKDITHLYNYTETMSDFIVDNYKLPEITLDLDLKKFINISLKTQMELNDFKNKSLKSHMELKMELEVSHKNQMELKMELNEMNKNFIRKTAVEYLNKYYDLFNPKFSYYNYRGYLYNDDNFKYNFYNGGNPFRYKYDRNTCLENKFDYFKLFEELLNIDYDNKIVSFAYFSDDKIDNFKSHPLYKIINNSLEYDYDWLNNTIDYTYTHPGIFYNDNAIRLWYKLNNGFFYIQPYQRNLIPFKTLCNYPIGKLGDNFIERIYNEYEYISSMISFVSIRPQKFM